MYYELASPIQFESKTNSMTYNGQTRGTFDASMKKKGVNGHPHGHPQDPSQLKIPNSIHSAAALAVARKAFFQTFCVLSQDDDQQQQQPPLVCVGSNALFLFLLNRSCI